MVQVAKRLFLSKLSRIHINRINQQILNSEGKERTREDYLPGNVLESQ